MKKLLLSLTVVFGMGLFLTSCSDDAATCQTCTGCSSASLDDTYCADDAQFQGVQAAFDAYIATLESTAGGGCTCN